jgi:hypothetical protein
VCARACVYVCVENNLKGITLKSLNEIHVARKTVEPVTFSNNVEVESKGF